MGECRLWSGPVTRLGTSLVEDRSGQEGGLGVVSGSQERLPVPCRDGTESIGEPVVLAYYWRGKGVRDPPPVERQVRNLYRSRVTWTRDLLIQQSTPVKRGRPFQSPVPVSNVFNSRVEMANGEP